MSTLTNVPNIVFSDAGLELPTESQILAGVLADFNAAFGGNLNTNMETPQGQLASSLAAIIGDKNAQIAYLVNQFDPNTSDGAYQEALGQLYFLTRLPNETRAQFELRRQQSVALNAHGSLDSILAAVAQVAGVTDVYVDENYTDQTVYKGSTHYPLLPHSLYVAASGGDDLAIAQAIFNKKDVGCNMNGNVAVKVTDPQFTGSIQPTYTMIFNRPSPVDVYINVQISNKTGLPSNISDLIKTAILKAFNGTDGSLKSHIGGLLLSSKFYAGVAALSGVIDIIGISVGITAQTLANSITMGIDQVPVLSAANITVELL